MSVNYGTYELSARQKWIFMAAGYSTLFGLAFLFYRSLIISIMVGCIAYLFLPRYADRLARSRRRLLGSQFRDLLLILSASVESGHHMEEALVEAAENMETIYPPDSPMMMELLFMKKSLEENNDNDVVLLTDFADRSCCDDIRNFVQVYLACRGTGGDIGKVISHTSKIMSDKMEIKAQIHVLTAQKKLEGRIISTMPLAMLLALNILSPAYISSLYTTGAGRMIMTLSLAGICTGLWLMEKFTDLDW